MDNPFKKRATEYFDDPSVMLPLVSVEPVKRFFAGDYEQLFDRSVIVVGTPGSGKTTLAQLLEFDALVALARNAHNNDNKALITEFAQFRILQNLAPTIISFRLPSGLILRDIWELPYSKSIKSALLRSFVQAKAVLGWLRKLEKADVEISRVKIVVRENFETVGQLIRTDDAEEFRNYARGVEERIFKIVTALVPEPESKIADTGLTTSYQAFDAIETIAVASIPGISDDVLHLKPLFILDDAHELHSEQFNDVEAWLRQRDLKIGRWIMTRVDALGPDEFRSALSKVELSSLQPGTTAGRDRVIKLMHKDRSGGRSVFRSIAKDIAHRYLEHMASLRRRVVKLESCLDAQPVELSASNLKKLASKVDSIVTESGFSRSRLGLLESRIPDSATEDQRLALMRILVTREMRRTPQTDLFATEADLPEPEDIKRASPSLVTGANIQLHHEFERPLYFSFDMLADASSENIEQFINLAGSLVDVIETRVMRGSPAQLDAKLQHQTLVKRANETVRAWNFPHSDAVKRLVEFIATKCKERTLLPNAPLDDGANAFGIPQEEMQRFQKDGGALVPVLHYALAYNALTLIEEYPCKGKSWCLFELGGLPILTHGLTLGRGGFCEGHLTQLVESIATNA